MLTPIVVALTLTTATPSEPPLAAPTEPSPLVDGEAEEPSPWSHFGPISWDTQWPLFLDDLHEDTQDQLWTFWLFPFFLNVLAPVLFAEGPMRTALLRENAVLLATHALPHLAWFAVNYLSTFVAIPGIGASMFAFVYLPEYALAAMFTGAGLLLAYWGCFALNGLACVCNLLWCLPVALANTHSRVSRARDLGELSLRLPRRQEARAAVVMAY